MANFETERGFESASPDKAAELYWLVQTSISKHGGYEDDDEDSRSAEFGYYPTENGERTYNGYISVESVNPFALENRVGLCATVSVGELTDGVDIKAEDVHDRRELDHLVTNYYIFFQGSSMVMAKNTNIKKPGEIDSQAEAEAIASGEDDINMSLLAVYADEAEEVTEKLKTLID